MTPQHPRTATPPAPGSGHPAPARAHRRPVGPLQVLPQVPRDVLAGTWRDARPARIRRALAHAQARDPGGWHVVAPSNQVAPGRSAAWTVAGREVTLWRAGDGALLAGPGACPHLGALLDDCEVMGDRIHCRWHGLALGPGVRRDWPTYPALDDGVLAWVRLPTDGETPTEKPAMVVRPPRASSFATVITVQGTCEPQDVIANRLDPWHGTWYHPYAFSHLSVDDAASTPARLVVDVAFRVTRRHAVPVRTEFTCPDARTIVMTITGGEGTGSVVETHATLRGRDRTGQPTTIMTEATIAHSGRAGFALARAAAALLRPAVAATARRLWVDDMAYAERRWQLRDRGETHGY